LLQPGGRLCAGAHLQTDILGLLLLLLLLLLALIMTTTVNYWTHQAGYSLCNSSDHHDQ
jgi:uncharacterized integral membrane protein